MAEGSGASGSTGGCSPNAAKEEEDASQPDVLWSVWGLLLFVGGGGERNKQKISISRALGLFLLVACDCIFQHQARGIRCSETEKEPIAENIIGPCLF